MRVFLGVALILLSACGQGSLFERKGGQVDAVAASPPPEGMARPLPRPDGARVSAPAANARTVEQFDTTTQAERVAAATVAPVASERRLGVTIASLGDPTDPGFWAETGLVSSVTKGRLDYPTTGTSVAVELRPSGGAPGSGSRVSLPALRVLGAPLTSLPELVVTALE